MNSRSMAGWIGFAGILMVLLGGLSVVQGLIALLEDNYYVVTPSGYLLFDVTGWGWIMLIWGIILALVGLALLNGASWARWTAIVLVSINVFGQLGFLGNSNDTVWLLTTLTFNIIILYALIVRWHDSQGELQNSLRTPKCPSWAGAAHQKPPRTGRRPAKGHLSPRYRGWTKSRTLRTRGTKSEIAAMQASAESRRRVAGALRRLREGAQAVDRTPLRGATAGLGGRDPRQARRLPRSFWPRSGHGRGCRLTLGSAKPPR